ncbi:hypothetical protein IGJ41_002749 [Enterococcus sp. DIV1537a]|uniref:MucBP domain-containing protein n=1 Tax=Enterococcus sp. DIV1537a TaxID=2774733 RepID=UPI003F25438B
MKHKHIRMFSTLLLMLPVIGQGVAVSAQGVTDETSMSTKLKTETTAIESKVLSPLGESSKEDTNELEKGTSKESLSKEDPTLRSMAESENMTSPTTSISTITIETSSTEEKVKIKGSDTSKEGDVASGTYGTAPWRLDGDGTLHISAGAFNEDAVPWKNHAEIIKKIVFEGTVIAYEDSNGLFSDLPQVTEINGLDKLDVSSVTSMRTMFSKDTNLTTLDVSKWDTSKVTTMYAMFSGASSLTTLDVSGWNTANVISMSFMFNGASSLTTLDVSGWDTANVKDMTAMFSKASSLTTLDVSGWDTANVTDMGTMFNGASSLTTLDVSGWNTANVKDMTAMFNGASNLTTLDVSGWNTANVKDMSAMFLGASSLTTLDVSGWNTANVTDMNTMFYEANSLITLDVSKWDTSKVTTMYAMFYNAYKLRSITLGPNFKFMESAHLVSPEENDSYSGKWKYESDLEGHAPETPLSLTATEFMSTYDGTKPGTYVWETKDPVAGADVTVHYEDDKGAKISEDVVLKGNVGDDYTSEQKTIPGYTFSKVEGAATGKFTDQAQTVKYVYTKDPVAGADVTVHYEDDKGAKISEDVVLKGNVGDDYTSEQKTIPGYTFSKVEGAATGKFTDQAQTVKYVYTKDPVAGADVTVHYEDDKGAKISEDVVLKGNVGDDYTSEQKTIPGYTFSKVEGAATGKFTDQAQTVKYVYTKDPVAGADVTVHYEDDKGAKISEDVVLKGNVGDDYTSEQKTIPGYTFSKVEGAATGKFTDQAQTVKYVYTKDPVAGADVTVHYEDDKGAKISEDVVLKGNVGDDYTSEQKTIPGYTFSKVEGAATGKFTDQAQTVKYVYTKDPVAGADVTVHYEDDKGAKISEDVVLKGNVGDDYTSEQKTIPGYTFSKVEGAATGKFTDQAQTVKYVYTKDPVAGADVTVHYEDDKGAKISEDVVLKGNVGDDYTSEQKTIPGYTFSKVEGAATGKFTDQAQTVKYVYTKDPVAGADVTVHYEDDKGAKISEDVVLKGNVGDDYTSEQKTIPGYTFSKVEGAATGKFTDQAQTVKYVYTKDPVAGADVTVHYEDDKGAKISEDVVLKGNVGDDYTSEQKTIPGYTFSKVEGAATGKFTDQAQTVKYVYTKDPVAGADVTVHYEDDKGAKISEDVVLKGNVGDDYTSEQKTIPGYTFSKVEGAATGKFTDQAQTVKYVYTKDPVAGADVTVHYEDDKGAKISEDVVLKGNVGDDYTSEQKTIPGYTFSKVEGAATGKFTDQAQTVKYVYTKDPVAGADVTVHYEDDKGAKISEDVVLKGNVGDDYTSEQKTIPGYTFSKVEGAATGKFTDQAQTVKYVYTKDPVAGADVTVHYEDDKGAKISEDVVLKGNVGDDYTSEQKTIPGYTFSKVEGAATGKFTDQAQTVKYVYTKDKEAPSKEAQHDTKGNSSGKETKENEQPQNKKEQEGQSKPEEKGSEENTLPHTGTKNSPLLATLGAAILGIGALMFPFKKKGKHRKP